MARLLGVMLDGPSSAFSRTRWAVAIFAVVSGIFLLGAPRQLHDSRFALLLGESILRHGELALDRYELGSTTALPYQLEAVGGHVFLRYPPGSSILSLPLFAVLRAAGIGVIDEHGRYDFEGEAFAQRVIAAVLSGALVAILFLVASRLVAVRESVVFALVTAFGTSIWSSSSRALWSHTWSLLLGAMILAHLLAREQDRRRPSGVWLGVLASAAYAVRPTNALLAPALTLFLAARDRRAAAAFLATGVTGFGLFVLVSWAHSGRMLPSYYLTPLSSETLAAGLAGVLASPSRGLLLYSPTVVVALGLALGRARRVEHRALALLASALVAGNLFAAAASEMWWGGHSVGPRLVVEAIPGIFVLGVLGWRAFSRDASRRARRAVLGVAAAAALVSFAMHARGVFSEEPGRWNAFPVDVDRARERLWDWSDPPFLRGVCRRNLAP